MRPAAPKLRKPVVMLLHWKQEEIGELAGRVQGFEIDCCVPVSGEGTKTLTRKTVPDVLLVSLERLPSHGYEVAHHLQKRKDWRHVPIVFAGGAPDKFEKIRAAMPNARFCQWDSVSQVLQAAFEHQPLPQGAPAPKPPPQRPMYLKLGLAEGQKIALLAPPADLYRLVPDLPFELEVTEQPDSSTDLVLWFVRADGEVDDGFAWITSRMSKPRVWVFYARGSQGGLTWTQISERAAQFGLAQYKILRLDDTWTGVIFGLKRT